ncbi:MAG: hypothetical protein FWE50_03970 [Alphaproteobacteria bacterium]|nr:hypothetical protein [Alphaproteobacteria bacterium]
MSKEIILTGIKPTGTPHLGNLVGAIKPIIEMSQGRQAFVFIADLHALNMIHSPAELQKYTLEVAASFIALGLDTSKAVFFRQSDVPEVAYLSTLLMNVTPKGLMNRAHSYKEIQDINREKAFIKQMRLLEEDTVLNKTFSEKCKNLKDRYERLKSEGNENTEKSNQLKVLLEEFQNITSVFEKRYKEHVGKSKDERLIEKVFEFEQKVQKNVDLDIGINMGLYTYPVLMSADILLYNSDIVPVGKDQKQHVEFARDIAGSFNAIYGETFKLPQPFIQEDTGLIPGLDGRKMSKSYGNQIPIFDSEAELKKKIMRIITDSKLPEEPKNPDNDTIFLLYKHFADAAAVADLRTRFEKGGLGYGDAKKILYEAANDYLAAPRARYEALMKNPKEVYALLGDGAKRAREVAAATTDRVKRAMKLDYFN